MGLIEDSVFNNTFQLDNILKEVCGLNVDSMEGLGTFDRIYSKLKEMQRILSLKR